MVNIGDEVRKTTDSDADNSKTNTEENKKTILTEEDILWLGNCSIRGFEQNLR